MINFIYCASRDVKEELLHREAAQSESFGSESELRPVTALEPLSGLVAKQLHRKDAVLVHEMKGQAAHWSWRLRRRRGHFTSMPAAWHVEDFPIPVRS